MNFGIFIDAIRSNVATMMAANGHLLITDLERDTLWDTYLNSFTEEQNPMYRQRREYDCNCCKNFIRRLGDASVFRDGKRLTIWDGVEGDFKNVADAMRELVLSSPAVSRLYTDNVAVGTAVSYERKGSEATRVWSHLSVHLKPSHLAQRDKIGAQMGASRERYKTTERFLKEIKVDAIDAVIRRVGENSIYRASSISRQLLVTARSAILEYEQSDREAKAGLVWELSDIAIATLRNTALGTLLQDLSNGINEAIAVSSYEQKVDPTVYQRASTSAISQNQVEAAKATLTQLGLLTALDRRLAVAEDLPLEHLLFLDRGTSVLKGPLDDLVVDKKAPTNVTEIDAMSFIQTVLPFVDKVEVFLGSNMSSNMVNLVTAADPEASRLFQWSNSFSWSYAGNFTDAVKERVKAAGGIVDAELCIRLAWRNLDDLDLFLTQKRTNRTVFYANKRDFGATLDVDMNCAVPQRNAVENIYVNELSDLADGLYTVAVSCYARRESTDREYEIHFVVRGETQVFAGANCVKRLGRIGHDHDGEIQFEKKGSAITVLNTSLDRRTAAASTSHLFGLTAGAWHTVTHMMFSPNHWDAQVGQKHLLFMLKDCVNPNPVQGIYNEFLRSDLKQHRKVFELLGSKLKAQSQAQLSGLGFALDARNRLAVRVTGADTRRYIINF